MVGPIHVTVCYRAKRGMCFKRADLRPGNTMSLIGMNTEAFLALHPSVLLRELKAALLPETLFC